MRSSFRAVQCLQKIKYAFFHFSQSYLTIIDILLDKDENNVEQFQHKCERKIGSMTFWKTEGKIAYVANSKITKTIYLKLLDAWQNMKNYNVILKTILHSYMSIPLVAQNLRNHFLPYYYNIMLTGRTHAVPRHVRPLNPPLQRCVYRYAHAQHNT